MSRLLLVRAVVVVCIGALIPQVQAEDAPPAPTPAPVPDAEREAALKRAEDLDRKVEELYGQGRCVEATPLARESLRAREATLGAGHPLVATSLNNLAMMLQAQGIYGEARPLHERALAIREKALGKDHPDVAESSNNLADLLASQGALAEARPLQERALAIWERTLGGDHPLVATSLNNLGRLVEALGDYAEARRLHEKALAIRRKSLGPDHADVGVSLNNLASALEKAGEVVAARTHYEASVDVLVRSIGRDHPITATALGNLANLLCSVGDFAEARWRYGQALEATETALGKDHPLVATSLNNLAMMLQAQGIYGEARPLHERALAIREKALGKDHPDVAGSSNNLAELLASQGALAEARPLQERALAIWERTLGGDHPLVATSLNNLGRLVEALGDYAEARRFHERALGIRQVALGGDHADVGVSLHNLAHVRAHQGAFADAKALYERALGVIEKALGHHHSLFATILHEYASFLEAQGAYAAARPLYERTLTIDETNVRAQLHALSASQRLARVRSLRYRLDAWIGFAPRVSLSGHAEALRLRGIVSRAEAAERALARRATAEQRATFESLQAATRLAARLANQPPSKPEARAAWQERYAKVAAERERLTRELSAQVASARTALERLDLTEADVRRALAADAALVEVLRVGERYVAWVLRSTGDVARVEVGAADAIDAACEAFVTAVTDDAGDEASREAIAKAGADLRALVWAPLETKLGESVRRVVICPDAALASVPFAALPGKAAGTYLGDEVAISHVFHPFDLVPRPGESHGVGALVVGGVDYDRADVGSRETPLPARPAALASLDRAPRGGSFSPIPATKAEAEALRDRFGKDTTTLLLGSDATEARLREGVKGKRFVHVATHGFARTDLLAGLYDRKITDAFLSADAERQLSVGHDPMLLSGLALAGANPRDGAGGDDGILTALEASYLDLDGVDLVTLSACETAKGTAESGEGVLGLVSAFQMAGARGVLASLWKVDDEATQRLMEGVYERMLRKESPLSPADALREAARALRGFTDGAGKARYAAPRYWAAFVAYGG